MNVNQKKITQWMLAAVVVCCTAMPMFTSCIKDEPANNECDVLSAWVEGDDYESYFYQKGQMQVEALPSNVSEIVFTVRSLLSLPPMPVSFSLTPGATISPASGTLQDFASGPVTYTVTSEDGAWSREYKVFFREADLPTYKFSFEHVEEELLESSNSTYHVFYETDEADQRHNIWSSGNQGFAVVQARLTPDRFPTKSSPDGYLGKCVCLTTQYAGDLAKMMGKPIAAGNLFLGSFNLIQVLVDPLKATEFGIPIDKEPVRVTGYYKYKVGEKFTNKSMKEVADRIDEAHIYAVFYRNTDADGNKVVLYGDDVLTSPYIVRQAQLFSLPQTDEWTRFEMFFEGDDADPAVLASLGYSMTLVFSSSRKGDVFEGAIGSTLYVDEVEVSFEKGEEE
jgi:hypothetical protein